MHKTLDFSASILPIGFPPPEYGVEGIWWEDRHMVIYRALRKQDMLRVLLKTPRASSQAPETRVDFAGARVSNHPIVGHRLCGKAVCS